MVYATLLLAYSKQLCVSLKISMYYIVVATTHQNSTCSLLTLAKLLTGYLVVGIIRELDKEPSLYCSTIYINTT